MMSNRFILGLTGGVGSGKSLLLDHLSGKYGAQILVLDDIAKAQWAPGGPCYEKVKILFGNRALDDNGELDRGRIAGIVFNDQVMLDKLNAVVHPEVRKRVKEMIDSADDGSFTVIESAILIESGYGEICDEIWYLYTDENVRRDRLKETRGYSDAKIDSIISNQMTDEEFRGYADFVLDNSGDFADTAAAADKRVKDEILQYCQRKQR